MYIPQISCPTGFHSHQTAFQRKSPPTSVHRVSSDESHQIALSIPYTSTLSPSNAVQELPNLLFERAAVLFNLAALYSQLAVAQDRSNTDGIKRAILHAQVDAVVQV
jgi:hypothetical protein